MRGEETSVAGLMACGVDSGAVCLPGSHSKWVRLVDGRLTRFSSALTGEAFAVLSQHTVLRLTVASAESEPDAVFSESVKEAVAQPENTLCSAFGLRPSALLDGLDPVASRSRLSGLLIGLELAAVRDYWRGADYVHLIGEQPLVSIERLAKTFGQVARIGAGTVLTAQQVDDVATAGGTFIVSPNCEPAVITHTVESGLASCPGVFTPSECFAALKAGAHLLKLFPAEVLGPRGVAALRAVLPANTRVYAVGGVSETNLGDWLSVGTTGFGIGSALYRPGQSAAATAQKAHSLVVAYDAQCKTSA